MALTFLFGGSAPLVQQLCAAPTAPHEAHTPQGVSCYGPSADAHAAMAHTATAPLAATADPATPDATDCLTCCVLACAEDGAFTSTPPASESLSKLLLTPAPSHPAKAPMRASRAQALFRSGDASPSPTAPLFLLNAVLLR